MDAKILNIESPFQVFAELASSGAGEANTPFWGSSTAVLREDEITAKPVYMTRIQEAVDVLKRW